MKNFLFILSALIGLLLLSPDSETGAVIDIPTHTDTIMEKESSDLQHQISILSSDLKGSSGRVSRRINQQTNNTITSRTFKIAVKQFHGLLLKRTDSYQKVKENMSAHQILNVSSLFSGTRLHVYALRKLVI